MTILRQIQSTTENISDAAVTYKQVSEELSDLLRFIPEDAVSQKFAIRFPLKTEKEGETQPGPKAPNDWSQSEWRPVRGPYPGWQPGYPQQQGRPPQPENKPPKAEVYPEWGYPEWVRPDYNRPTAEYGPHDYYPYPEGGGFGSGFNILKIALHPILDVLQVVRNLVNVLI